MNTQQQTHALSLMQAGFKLTVLNGKRPILDEWQNNPIDAATVSKHAGNFGIITGHGFFVFDVDNIDAFMFFLMENGLTMPNDTTCTVETAKGFHYYFTLPSSMQSISNGVRLGKSDAFPKGFGDIRGTGGQVVAPGGIHPETGKTYTANNLPIAACPEWLETLIASHGVREAHVGSRGEVLIESDDVFAIDRATTYLKRAEPATEGNGGDHQTFATFARLRDFGISLETAITLAEEHWNPRNQPPWMPDDLRIKAENAYNYAANPQGIANPLAAFQSLGLTPTAPAVQSAEKSAEQHNALPNPSIKGADPREVSMGIGYEQNHTTNAARFLQEWYPAGTIKSRDGLFYWFNGQVWEAEEQDTIRSAVMRAMMNAQPSSGTVRGTVDILSSLVFTSDKLDTFDGQERPELIALANGILNAKTGELTPHDMRFFTTHCMDFAYNPAAQAPRFMQYLQEATEGDAEFIECLQIMMGQIISGSPVDQFPVIVGRGGSGKTILENVIRMILGEHNAVGLNLSDLGKQFGLEPAIGKRLITFSDERNSAQGFRDGLSTILKITGGNDVQAHRKNKTSVRLGRVSCLYISNELPRFTDASGAMERRLVIFPFNRVIPANQRDPELFNKLKAEAEGILLWAIEGVKKFYAKGGKLHEPKCAADMRRDTLEMANPLLQFVEDALNVSTDARCSQADLFSAYNAWCIRESERPLTKRSFKEKLMNTLPAIRFAQSMRTDDGTFSRGFYGVDVKDFMTVAATAPQLSVVKA